MKAVGMGNDRGTYHCIEDGKFGVYPYYPRQFLIQNTGVNI